MVAHSGSSSNAEPLTMLQAIATVLKCMIGAGILTLPYSCSRVGLGLALPGLVVVAALNALGIWRIVQSKIHLTAQGYGALPEPGSCFTPETCCTPELCPSTSERTSERTTASVLAGSAPGTVRALEATPRTGASAAVVPPVAALCLARPRPDDMEGLAEEGEASLGRDAARDAARDASDAEEEASALESSSEVRPALEDGEASSSKDSKEESCESCESCEGSSKDGSGAPVQPDRAEDWGLGPAAMVAYKTFGRPGLVLTAAALMSAQVGVCVCYVDVVVETLLDLSGGRISRLPLRCGLCVVQCLLCLVRRLKDLAWLSGLALAVYVLVVVALVRCGTLELAGGGGAEGAVGGNAAVMWPVRWSGFGAWYGSSIFAFEGITIAQYVYDDMRLSEPTPFIRVLAICYMTCFMLYAFIGGFGYMAYGDAVKKVIYLSFPPDSPDVVAAKVVLCFVLVLSFVLQMYPVFHFAESSTSLDQDTTEAADANADVAPGNPGRRRCLDILLRWGLVSMTFVIAALVPDVSQVTDYVGSISFGAVGYLLPALFHIKVFASEGISPLSWTLDALLILGGLLAMGLGVSE